MESRKKIAEIIKMRDEVAQQGQQASNLFAGSPNRHIIINRYLILVGELNKEIKRLRDVESLIEDWYK